MSVSTNLPVAALLEELSKSKNEEIPAMNQLMPFLK